MSVCVCVCMCIKSHVWVEKKQTNGITRLSKSYICR